MSAQRIRVVPRDQRLRITAKFQHETVQYAGNAFEFLERLMADGLTGIATVRLNRGKEYSLEFDLREAIAIDGKDDPV